MVFSLCLNLVFFVDNHIENGQPSIGETAKLLLQMLGGIGRQSPGTAAPERCIQQCLPGMRHPNSGKSQLKVAGLMKTLRLPMWINTST